MAAGAGGGIEALAGPTRILDQLKRSRPRGGAAGEDISSAVGFANDSRLVEIGSAIGLWNSSVPTNIAQFILVHHTAVGLAMDRAHKETCYYQEKG